MHVTPSQRFHNSILWQHEKQRNCKSFNNLKNKLDTGIYNTIVHLDIAKAYDSI